MINSWSISGNSCKKIIRAIRVIRFNPLSKNSVYICAICGKLFVSFELFVFKKKSVSICVICGSLI